MRDFLRKKRHTDTAEPDTAPDTASIRTPAETTAPERKHKQWYLRFARQQLVGWSPIITGNLVIVYLFATAVVCFALGLPILLASTQLPVYAVRYDNAVPFTSSNSLQKQQLLSSYRGEGAPVTVPMTVRKRLTQPVSLPSSALLSFSASWLTCGHSQSAGPACGASSSSNLVHPPSVRPSDCHANPPWLCRCTCPLSLAATTKITSGASLAVRDSHICLSSGAARQVQSAVCRAACQLLIRTMPHA